MGIGPSAEEREQNNEEKRRQYAKDLDPHPASGDRSMQDIICLILFVVFWIGMLVVGVVALTVGEPARLVLPSDETGQTCGLDNTRWITKEQGGLDLTKKEYLYLPNTADLKRQQCVAACPTTGSIVENAAPLLNSGGDPICGLDKVICYNGFNASIGNYVGLDFKNFPAVSVGRKCFCPYKTKSYLFRCVPVVGNNTSDAEAKKVDKAATNTDLVYTVFSDVARGWWAILIAALVTGLLCFAYMWVLRKICRVVAWGTIIGVIVMLAALTIFCFTTSSSLKAKADDTNDDGVAQNALAYEVLSYIFAGITLIAILVIIWMRSRIEIAIELIEEATICMQMCPELIFLPVLLFAVYLVFLAYWVTISLFLASSKMYNPATGDFEFASQVNDMIYFHLFGFYWTTNFITAVAYITVAGTAAAWYFTPYTDEAKREEKAGLEEGQTWKALERTCKYSLGSAAFGSLILSIVQFVRKMIEIAQKRLEEAGGDNIATRAILCLCNSFFACLERVIKFINRNAYIMVAIEGKSFCVSAYNAFKIVLLNLAQVTAVDVIGDFMLFLGKLMITIGVSLISGIVLSSDENMRFWVIPWLICTLLAYGISSMFMAIVELCIDTILLSYIIDRENHEDNLDEAYMSTDLKEKLEKFKEQHEEKMAEKARKREEKKAAKAAAAGGGDA